MVLKLNKKNNIINHIFTFNHEPSRAFTLAEIMVTLAVVGILAATLVPSLFKTTPDYNRVMFRKAFYNLQNAVSLMITDSVNYPKTQTATDDAGLTVERGFNYTTATTNGTKNKFCYFLTNNFNTIGAATCPATTGGSSSWDVANRGIFTTTDGVSWMLYFRNSDDAPDTQFPLSSIPRSAAAVYPVLVYIDVNGSKGPNCTASNGAYPGIGLYTLCPSTTDCSSDPDQFIIDVRYDGKLHLGGYHGSANTDKCAESILADPTNNKKFGT